MNTIKYKGFIAKIEIDETENLLFGRVVNTAQDVLTFHGKTVDEIIRDFHETVDDYLAWAEEEGFTPEKPHSGRFVTRLSPELHSKAVKAAAEKNMSLNKYVKTALLKQLKKEPV